jgi:hypothetical protein
MSDEGTPTQPPGGQQQPSEEELRARIEEQLKQVRVQDLLVESAASIVNLTARRIAKPDEQDLEQARIGIEAVRALVDLLDGEVEGQIRGALSELQLLYARASKGEPLEGAPETAPPPESTPPEPPPEPGPSKLWTPGRD